MTETIITEKMVFGGDCIAKIDGKTVFVPYSIPGEKLKIEITQDCGDFYRGKILEVLEPSPDRVMPFCSYYGRCGGCNLQHIDSSAQQKYRTQILKDAFLREGIETGDIEVISGASKGYRSRFQFHDGGLMEKFSNNIVPIENCPCAEEEINHYLREIPFDQRPEGRVHVFGSDKITSVPDGYDKLIIAEEIHTAAKKETVRKSDRTPTGRKLPKVKKIQKRFAGTSINPSNFCTVELNGKKISFDVQGFFQSNLEVLEKTIPYVTGGISGKNVLDMYAGAGTFSVFLADNFEKVTLVEHNRDAIVYAEQNLAGRKHESFGLSGEVWTKYHAEKYTSSIGGFDAAVIDPPRSGMEKSVCQWLCSSGIPHIRSVSCNAATHARDAKFLIRAGYRLSKLYLLDFYPQTCHIESLAWFEK
ncbi:class I SAM-dependent RNA methyltransferase [Treponema rectale]|uniref:23S rRNA (Uracil1939-C5)-methyltransferase n=1 Tax=Treponema rectale TaxID=744512 RepID=A0A840SDV1_9SPIR|nr:class I SAM-dependent RNA methyltransferase [Treponema rectale]MBB5218368.1 23S rRNA (uracil1939-C5)-methyltransferase [Treponema rectale]QOS39936.1 class I SAM-dependent RNA methyltransferase [Treponema rectale]